MENSILHLRFFFKKYTQLQAGTIPASSDHMIITSVFRRLRNADTSALNFVT